MTEFVQLKVCNHPECYREFPVHERSAYCKLHRMDEKQPMDSDGRRKSKHRRNAIYGKRWEKASKRYRLMNPACVKCGRMSQPGNLLVVDHIIPHRGDYDLFWDESNWQSLCASCHMKKTQQEMKDRRYGQGGMKVNADGSVSY